MGRNKYLVLWLCLFHVSIIAGVFDPGVAILDVIWRMCLCSSGNIVMVNVLLQKLFVKLRT